MIYNMQNLPEADNLSRYSFSIDVHNEMYIQKGKMIAYYGRMRFEAIGSDVLDILVKEAFNAPKYVNNFVVVTGEGKLILADDCRDIASYVLEDANLTIKSDHVLGFAPTLTCQESLLPGYLTFLGSGRLIASSNGPVHFLETPVRVDEDALVGWGDIPSPSYYYDYKHAESQIGSLGALTQITLTGEEKQVNFVGEGTVLIQSSELKSGPSSALVDIIEKMGFLNPEDKQTLSAILNDLLKTR